ncbi:CPBP family intramembrane glutamic endopeptidase [Spongiivirga sp. MCCC 1A20706]|uniref:CPBP family intramembrane glutamic endopeptidase n=1 Tax=Spongiivirga sp. MCCC 1A20706 TaxID=3160963 RepID=UPI0039773B90
MNNRKITVQVIIFSVFVLLWSLLWTIYKTELSELYTQQWYFYYLFGLVPAIGLSLGALVFRKNNITGNFTLSGKNGVRSVTAAVIPVILLTIVGVANSYQVQENIFGFYTGCIVLVYVLMEEYGWRGYLHPALFSTGLNKWLVYVITGSIWYLWHWFFLRSESGSSKIALLPLLIFASAGLDIILQKTKSILWCGSFHSIVNILFMYGVVSNAISKLEKAIILLVSILIWTLLLKRYNASKHKITKDPYK